ncbi:MAG: FAD-binding oxidoreductase, partial [Acidobacteria bacterium]
TAAEVASRAPKPLALPHRITLNLPFDVPSAALNRFSVGLFNAVYYGLHRNGLPQLVDFERFFYPLDAIDNWNRMYGKRGFVQHQVVLPVDAGREGLTNLLERLTRAGRAPFLGVLKRFGDANPGLLSFPMKGYTLALDLPVDEGLVGLLRQLDDLVRDYGGRVYLAKDAALRPETFAAMYPNLDRFRALKQKLDPKGLLSSSLARRLRIVDG